MTASSPQTGKDYCNIPLTDVEEVLQSTDHLQREQP
jgi:hypothetical protein